MRAGSLLLFIALVAVAAASNVGPLELLQRTGAQASALKVEDAMELDLVKDLREQRRPEKQWDFMIDDSEFTTMSYDNDTNTDEGITAGGIASIVVVCMVVLAYALAFAFHCYREKLWKKFL